MSRLPRYRYAAFGLTIESEVSLAPLFPEHADAGRHVDVTLSLGIPPGPRSDRDVEFGVPGVLHALVRAGSQAYVDPDPGLTSGLLAEYLCNVVLAILMEQRGAFVLHASAVEIADGIVAAFTGASGAGKSTTAGFFASRGFAVASDDLLPLTLTGRGVVCEVGPEALKFNRDSAVALPALAPAAELHDKRMHAPVRRRESSSRRDVAALYVLEDGQAVAVRPMRGHAAVGALLGASYCLSVVGPAKRAPLLVRCARIASHLRVSALIRPRDWASADAVVDLVAADVADVVHQRAASAPGST